MTTEDIKKVIEDSIKGSTAIVLDPMNDGQHLQAFVIAEQFKDMMLVKQHQMVMKLLKEAFDSDSVHALGLKTFTPDRWNEVRDQYGI